MRHIFVVLLHEAKVCENHNCMNRTNHISHFHSVRRLQYSHSLSFNHSLTQLSYMGKKHGELASACLGEEMKEAKISNPYFDTKNVLQVSSGNVFPSVCALYIVLHEMTTNKVGIVKEKMDCHSY